MSTTSDEAPDRSSASITPADAQFEDDLRRHFAAERAHDAMTELPFARVLAPRRRMLRRTWLRPAAALGAMAALVVAAGVWRRQAGSDAQSTVVLIAGQMRVPTDFLLDLASSTTTRAGGVPSIGSIDWYPLVPQSDMAPNITSRRN